MADEKTVVVHLTGISRTQAEAALGHRLTPINASGDQFRVPVGLVEHLGELPLTPPQSSDSVATKRAVQALPLDLSSAEAPVADESADVEAEDE